MAELSQMKSISQARAKFAWECASSKGKDYGRQVGKTPTYIKTNGLLNTMAFFCSKPGEGKGDVLKHICDWLTGQNLPPGVDAYPLIDNSKLPAKGKYEEKVLNYLMTSDTRFLIQCTTEVLALFNWLRRFAKTD
ncbi:MAG: type III-B CRISPR module-associated protein Cmr5 [Bernardetiaceae bacterium]|nr:type III-B CRISPR module-associated protein Cmr5 [Bernardetiaceae bacterium]